MHTNNKIYIFAISLIVAAGAMVFFLCNKNSKNPTADIGAGFQSTLLVLHSLGEGGNPQPSPPTQTPANTKVYSGQGFSFSYPEGMSTSEIPDKDNNAKTVLLQDPKIGAGCKFTFRLLMKPRP